MTLTSFAEVLHLRIPMSFYGYVVTVRHKYLFCTLLGYHLKLLSSYFIFKHLLVCHKVKGKMVLWQ
jgi:hypothetical protein